MIDVNNINRGHDEQSVQSEAISTVLNLLGISDQANITKIVSGGMNLVYIVNDELVVRLNDRRDGKTFEREVKVLSAIRGKVKVPEIVFSDCSQTQIPFDIIVLKKIPGMVLTHEWGTLTTPERRDRVAQICHELRNLHKIPLSNITELVRSGSWSNRFERYVDNCLKLASEDDEIDDDVIVFLREYYEMNKGELETPCQQVLTHNDPHFGNVLVRGGNLQALLDFEYADIGPLDFELAKIINFCLTPSQYVEKHIEGCFNKPMLEILKWFTEFYPELSQQKATTTRQRLFLIPEILWSFKVAHMQKPYSDKNRYNNVSIEEIEQNRKRAYNKLHHIFGEHFML